MKECDITNLSYYLLPKGHIMISLVNAAIGHFIHYTVHGFLMTNSSEHIHTHALYTLHSLPATTRQMDNKRDGNRETDTFYIVDGNEVAQNRVWW
jgi:hypothetical protein